MHSIVYLIFTKIRIYKTIHKFGELYVCVCVYVYCISLKTKVINVAIKVGIFLLTYFLNKETYQHDKETLL
jgi:hypothetical protein